MKYRISLMFFLLLALNSAAVAQHDYEEQLIFPLQDKHVHSSTLVQTPEGDILAAWFHGSGERKSNDVQVLGARLNADSDEWSEVFPMADTPGLPDCNPVLFIDPQEKLWLFYLPVVANRWERSLLKYRTATDYEGDGAPEWDWQDVIILDPGEDFQKQVEEGFDELGYSQPMWAEYAHEYTDMLTEAAADPVKRTMGWMTRSHPIVLESGRILLPLYSDGYNFSLVAYSDDNGETWTPSEPIIGLGPIQPSLAQQANGTVVAFMRDAGIAPRRVLRASSDDNGETWSTAEDTDIPNPSSTAAVRDLKDGRWVMIMNDTESGRHRIAAALSEDEGKTWSAKRVLDEAAPGEGSYSYPSVIQAADGRVHTTYSFKEGDGASIKHVAFAPDWILE